MSAPIHFVSLITRDNRPLYIRKFSPHTDAQESESPLDKESAELPSFVDKRDANEFLKYNFLSNMALDVFTSSFFESSTLNQNCALLFVEDGISVYGYETNTGLKIVIGTSTKGEKIGKQLDGVFKHIHKAYLRLICNPFQPLDENSLISSKRLEKSICDVVEVWNGSQK